MSSFETEALDELRQIGDLVEQQRTALQIIFTRIQLDPTTLEATMARMWLIGTVDSALWHIQRELSKGVPLSHSHCECRTPGCGHLDIRHSDEGCSFEGCKCVGWS